MNPEKAKIVHEVAVETRKLLNKAKEQAAKDRKMATDDAVSYLLRKIEALLDQSLLTSDEICQVLDRLKTRYTTATSEP